MDALTALHRRLRMANAARMRSREADDPQLRALLRRRAELPPREEAAHGDAGTAPDEAGTVSDERSAAPPIGEATPTPSSSSSQPAGTVLERRDLTDELAIFRLSKPADFTFEPGQHVRIHLGGASRPYSIASAPHEPFLELFVERAPEGTFTPALWRLRPGDRVDVGDRAKGSLVLDPSRPVHLMVATVTGVAPFISMLRTALATAGPIEQRFHLLHGASHADELGYADELTRMPITYVPAVSRPDDPRNADWSGATGRVHTLVEAHLQAHALRPHDTAAYACGHPEMVRAVERMLGRRGYVVQTERFFKD